MVDYSVKDDTLTIKLSGRIDSSNSAVADNEIGEICSKNSLDKHVFDMQELEYISSAGLRVLLKYKKLYDDFCIVNCGPVVYETLDITGFTSIFDVRKALRKMSLEGCEIIGSGAHGRVYRIDEDTIVKCYYDNSTYDDVKREVEHSRQVFVSGIPTAISYDIVDCGDGCLGSVYEMLKADTLAEYVTKHPDKLTECADKYADLFKMIHKTPTDNFTLPSTKDIYYDYAEKMREYLTDEEVSTFRRIIDSIPDGNSLIHGDFHAGNIMVQNDELMLIDVGDISIGHPIFDFIGAAVVMAFMGTIKKEITQIAMGLDYEYCKAMWKEILRRYFNISDEDKVEQMIKMSMTISLPKHFAVGATGTESAKRAVPYFSSSIKKLLATQEKPIIECIKSFSELIDQAL